MKNIKPSSIYIGKIKILKVFLALSLVPQLLLVSILSRYPEKVEFYFSQKIFPILFNANQFFFKHIPLSLGDCLYLILGIYLCYLIVYFIFKYRKLSLKRLINLGITTSLVFLIFQLNWGLNYHRVPLAKKLNVQKQYSDSLLIDLTSRFVLLSNKLHDQLSESDTMAIAIPYSKKKIVEKVHNNYSDLWESSIKVPKAKGSIFSLPLSYMGYAGYLNPFTLEAQVNMRIPKINLPVTIAHEMAHQLGYAAENEANFIALVNTLKKEDPFLKYAGALFALRHCYSDLNKRNPDQAKHILQELNPGIFKNLRENQIFWEQYKNPFEPLFKSSYDNYLKLNGQESGIKSYNQMVILLMAYYTKSEFELLN